MRSGLLMPTTSRNIRRRAPIMRLISRLLCDCPLLLVVYESSISRLLCDCPRLLVVYYVIVLVYYSSIMRLSLSISRLRPTAVAARAANGDCTFTAEQGL